MGAGGSGASLRIRTPAGGWLGEIAGLEVSVIAANEKLAAMNRLTERHGLVDLGMPDFRPATGRQG
ncbi:recombinase [Streptomyces sp. 769]|uniref:recombinase n=1 Tax=Streptomyces sp. 769 TaxID=1262452 RepID=UPI000A430024|nr:recombinase [Streptomyces sp. 769]